MATTPISTFSAAIAGGNDPTQDTSTLKGFYDAPNPFFRAMNQNTVTDIQTLSDGNVGTFLQRRNAVNGDVATIIDASLDYFLGDRVKNLPPISGNQWDSSTRRTFIPIVIKTEFKFNQANNNTVDTPLYIIFDSTPDNITFSKAANWTQKDFLGRPEPVWTYNNSSATTFGLTGRFFANSFEAHGRLLKLSDYIMSLVTPSQTNYMPSPVTVFIGEWKRLRCIVNNIQIKYEGPWVVKINSDDLIAAQDRDEGVDNLIRASRGKIDSHAPYMFEATFQFTIVGKDNEVNYAEQVVRNDNINNVDKLDQKDLEKISSILYQAGLRPQAPEESGLYYLSGTNKYTFQGGKIVQTTSNELMYTDAAKKLNLYDSVNAQRRLSDQGVISNAISSQMLQAFQNANPTSVNTPATTSSLNPFKKLF